jgi:dihydroxyacetone kinase-like protein
MMADSFLNSEGKSIVLDLATTIHENTSYLSEIDGAIGDGDHGINMNKGFTRCAEIIGEKDLDFSAALNTLGDILIGEIGGAMGPLYGTFFMEMASASQQQPVIDKAVFGAMLRAGLEGVMDLGGAQVGDKTMVDTLAPAYQAYTQALALPATFSEALQQMAIAAEKGMESTHHLVAKVGRASRLGERSRDNLDAGATSCFLILKSFSLSIQRLLSE